MGFGFVAFIPIFFVIVFVLGIKRVQIEEVEKMLEERTL
jgi:hypothetical protein